QTTLRTTADPLTEVTGRELLVAVDEEIQKLPERERAALVLCYLEGQTGDQAARRLGWAVRTLKRRLEEGRRRLRTRLARRGLMLGTILAVGELGSGSATAGVPVALTQSTIRAAVRLGCGTASIRVTTLANAALRTTGAVRPKLAVIAALMAGLTV